MSFSCLLERAPWPGEYALAAVDDGSPPAFQEAMQSDATKQREQAAASEYESLISNETWILVDPTPGAK